MDPSANHLTFVLDRQPGEVIITVDDDTHVFNPGEITPALAGALRQQSHGAWRVPTLAAAVVAGTGPEEVAGLLFLALRQAGSDTTYDQASALVSGARRITVDFGEITDTTAAMTEDSPEA